MRIKDMDRFEVLQIAISESGVEQERFPQPWLSQQGDKFLPALQAIDDGLQGGLMAPPQKEHV
jgi:hypothetical protein